MNKNEASKWILSLRFNNCQYWYYWYVSLSGLSYLGLIVISDKPDQSTVEHFQMLRRQWASKAQLLMATLDGLPDADTAAVQGKYQKTAAGARSELEDPIFGQHERTSWLRFSRFSHLYGLQFWTRENHSFFSVTCITDVISWKFFSFLWIKWQSKKKPSQGHF